MGPYNDSYKQRTEYGGPTCRCAQISNPGWAIANVQVNKGAKDPAAKALLKKGNTGPHKTTHKNVASIRYSQTNYDNDAFQNALEKAKQADGTTITVEKEEPSGSGHGKSGESSKSSGQDNGEWEDAEILGWDYLGLL